MKKKISILAVLSMLLLMFVPAFADTAEFDVWPDPGYMSLGCCSVKDDNEGYAYITLKPYSGNPRIAYSVVTTSGEVLTKDHIYEGFPTQWKIPYIKSNLQGYTCALRMENVGTSPVRLIGKFTS